MTTVATRVREIAHREKFDIVIRRLDGQVVAVTENGVIGAYSFRRGAPKSWRVSKWKTERFEAAYPGFTCDVLDGVGNVVVGQTQLSTVRDSYNNGP